MGKPSRAFDSYQVQPNHFLMCSNNEQSFFSSFKIISPEENEFEFKLYFRRVMREPQEVGGGVDNLCITFCQHV